MHRTYSKLIHLINELYIRCSNQLDHTLLTLIEKQHIRSSKVTVMSETTIKDTKLNQLKAKTNLIRVPNLFPCHSLKHTKCITRLVPAHTYASVLLMIRIIQTSWTHALVRPNGVDTSC